MSRVRHASTHVQLLQGTDNLTHSEDEHQQVCVQLHTSAVNVTLLAFAAERRAAAPCCGPVLQRLCCWAPGACRCRSIFPTRTALRSKHKKLSYRRVTARCVLSVVILPITTQQCRNYLYDKS